jgi:ribonuclease PH
MKLIHVYQLELKGTPWLTCGGIMTIRTTTVFPSSEKAEMMIPVAIQKSIDHNIFLPEKPGQAIPIECKVIKLEIVY